MRRCGPAGGGQSRRQCGCGWPVERWWHAEWRAVLRLLRLLWPMLMWMRWPLTLLMGLMGLMGLDLWRLWLLLWQWLLRLTQLQLTTARDRGEALRFNGSSLLRGHGRRYRGRHADDEATTKMTRPPLPPRLPPPLLPPSRIDEHFISSSTN